MKIPNFDISLCVREAPFNSEQSQSTQDKVLHDIMKNLLDLCHEDEFYLEKYEELDNEQFINQLYKVFLGRDPDQPGSEEYQEQLKKKISRRDVLCDIRTSKEAANFFCKKTSSLSNNTFLLLATLACQTLYKNQQLRRYEYLNRLWLNE